jgi:hypothetical protein
MMNYFFQSLKEEEGRAFAQVKTVDIKNLPFMFPNSEIQSELSVVVDQILTKKAQDSSADIVELETQINQLVYQLYGLTEEEITVIEEAQG